LSDTEKPFQAGHLLHDLLLPVLKDWERIENSLSLPTGAQEREILGFLLKWIPCQRASLLIREDSPSESWRVLETVTQSGYGGNWHKGLLLPREILPPDHLSGIPETGDSPLLFGTPPLKPPPALLSGTFRVTAEMILPVRSETGELMLLSLHRCTGSSVWVEKEIILFREAGLRYRRELRLRADLQKLTEKNKRLSEAVQVAHVGYWDRDLEAGLISLSPEAFRLFGLQEHRQEMPIGSWHKQWKELVHPEDKEAADSCFLSALKEGHSFVMEYRILLPDGGIRHIRSLGDVKKNRDHRVQRIYGTVQDITTQKEAEERQTSILRFFESMDRISKAIQQTDALEGLSDPVLKTVRKLFGCSRVRLEYPCLPESAAGDSEDSMIFQWPPDRGNTAEPLSQAAVFRRNCLLLASPEPLGFPENPPGEEDTAGGEDGPAFLAAAVRPRTGPPWKLEIREEAPGRRWREEEKNLFREISRRLEDCLTGLLARRELREREEFFSSIVENLPNMVFVKDARDLRYVMVNQAGEKLLGIPRKNFIGKTDADFFIPEEAAFFTAKDREVLASGQMEDIPEEPLALPDGEKLILHTKKLPILANNGKPRYLLGISEDITRFRKLEEQLFHSQKMEAIGQLAGGVAHDFNNMLGVIIGHTELCLDGAGPDSALRDSLEEIEKAAQRSADLTRQLLTFARRQTVHPRRLDLNETVEGLLKMLRRVIGEQIELTWKPSAAALPVMIDDSQLNQILTNLCVNARDAISGKGKITIETAPEELKPEFCRENSGFLPGRFAVLQVEDTGIGMDAQLQSRVFEPFFTTKGVGQGTGLGLSMVYGIVQQNEGFIRLRSEPGKGTLFRIYLPLRDESGSEEETGDVDRPSQGGSETILLVEDEPSYLRIIRQMLENCGYRVLSAGSPGEAAEISGAYGEPIHLLVTDLVMPEMNGRDLAERLSSERPDMKILFLSGYSGSVLSSHGIREGISFLQKPFTIRSLSEKIRQILDYFSEERI